MWQMSAVYHWIKYITDNPFRGRYTTAMKQVKIKQVKSGIDRPKRQKETLKALGLRKINQEVVKELTPQIEGMINRVAHLVEVEPA